MLLYHVTFRVRGRSYAPRSTCVLFCKDLRRRNTQQRAVLRSERDRANNRRGCRAMLLQTCQQQSFISSTFFAPPSWKREQVLQVALVLLLGGFRPMLGQLELLPRLNIDDPKDTRFWRMNARAA